MKRSLMPVGRKVKRETRNWRLEAKGKRLTPQSPASLQPFLLDWYDAHRRILPWRALPGQKADPYLVWLSEIMLQQTTVGAVGPYFQKFIRRWPTIEKLAKARRDHILRMWAGLGYYRRAHLLHECARTIVRDYGGYFPQTETELRELPGFGAYTAAAVAAIAFNQRANVVDGNVERVIARLFAIREPLPGVKPHLRSVAAELLPQARYGDYAQALMDLGATICTPRNPKCDVCPLNKACRARSLGLANQLPRRIKATAKPVRRAIAFFVVNDKGRVLLRRRPKRGLLGGMMEIPASEWREGTMPALSLTLKEAPMVARWKLLPGIVRHVFSHFELELTVAVGQAAKAPAGKNSKWVVADRLNAEALPSVMRKVVRHAIESIAASS